MCARNKIFFDPIFSLQIHKIQGSKDFLRKHTCLGSFYIALGAELVWGSLDLGAELVWGSLDLEAELVWGSLDLEAELVWGSLDLEADLGAAAMPLRCTVASLESLALSRVGQVVTKVNAIDIDTYGYLGVLLGTHVYFLQTHPGGKGCQ